MQNCQIWWFLPTNPLYANVVNRLFSKRLKKIRRNRDSKTSNWKGSTGHRRLFSTTADNSRFTREFEVENVVIFHLDTFTIVNSVYWNLLKIKFPKKIRRDNNKKWYSKSFHGVYLLFLFATIEKFFGFCLVIGRQNKPYESKTLQGKYQLTVQFLDFFFCCQRKAKFSSQLGKDRFWSPKLNST